MSSRAHFKLGLVDTDDGSAFVVEALLYGLLGLGVVGPGFGGLVRKPEEEAGELAGVFFEFADVELVDGVGRFVMVVGVGMATPEAPAPEVGGVDGFAQEGEVIGRGIQLRHNVTLESVAHGVELALDEIVQMGKGEDDSLDVSGRQLVQVDGEARRLLRSVVTGDIGDGALEGLFLGSDSGLWFSNSGSSVPPVHSIQISYPTASFVKEGGLDYAQTGSWI